MKNIDLKHWKKIRDFYNWREEQLKSLERDYLEIINSDDKVIDESSELNFKDL